VQSDLDNLKSIDISVSNAAELGAAVEQLDTDVNNLAASAQRPKQRRGRIEGRRRQALQVNQGPQERRHGERREHCTHQRFNSLRLGGSHRRHQLRVMARLEARYRSLSWFLLGAKRHEQRESKGVVVGKSSGLDQDSGRGSVADRRAEGRARRKTSPRSGLGQWAPDAKRPDPVGLIEDQNQDRLPWLVPVRRGRMSESAFTFYRGAARIMSSDLSTTPASGLNAQLCGDAHLSNFGAYASAERNLVFDVNDFDETLVGPWEWDLKRLATSFVVAGRDRGFSDADGREAAAESASAYQTAMAQFADDLTLDIWYATLLVSELQSLASGKKEKRRVGKFEAKSQSKNSLQALSKLTEKVDGKYRIKSDPPVLVPLRDFPTDENPEQLKEMVDAAFESYKSSLNEDRRRVLERFEPIEMALKVVGVGSVGTRCLILLLEGRDEQDPLFLQIKEATASVLEDHLPASSYATHGERVVEGQQMMQASSDIFLGWAQPNEGHHYYWRQLKDWKGSVDITKTTPKQLTSYANLCGWTLAHSHARSGDPIAISGYMGSGKVLVDSIADFAVAYADQNDEDYRAFKSAIDDGSLEAETGV
jgi:uncharacterized protein (DUF2252 family)